MNRGKNALLGTNTAEATIHIPNFIDNKTLLYVAIDGRAYYSEQEKSKSVWQPLDEKQYSIVFAFGSGPRIIRIRSNIQNRGSARLRVRIDLYGDGKILLPNPDKDEWYTDTDSAPEHLQAL